MSAEIFWYEDESGCLKAEIGACTVAKIRYAEEGEAEGGLGLLARFMAGALAPGSVPPPLSPAGWYWQATATRGVWTRPALAESPELAQAAAEETLAEYVASLR